MDGPPDSYIRKSFRHVYAPAIYLLRYAAAYSDTTALSQVESKIKREQRKQQTKDVENISILFSK